MSLDPSPAVVADAPAESLEQRFDRLASRWLAETAHVSSSSQLVSHPAFVEIVAMGPAAIPLLLRATESRTGHWFRALSRITGFAPPIPESDRGSVAKAKEAWLRWGKEQGYQW